jgi:hypothetical protein
LKAEGVENSVEPDIGAYDDGNEVNEHKEASSGSDSDSLSDEEETSIDDFNPKREVRQRRGRKRELLLAFRSAVWKHTVRASTL